MPRTVNGTGQGRRDLPGSARAGSREVDGGRAACGFFCQLGRKPKGRGESYPSRLRRAVARAAPGARPSRISACCSGNLTLEPCDPRQIAASQHPSTMKAAVLLATAAHAAKQAVEEPAESPVAYVPVSHYIRLRAAVARWGGSRGALPSSPRGRPGPAAAIVGAAPHQNCAARVWRRDRDPNNAGSSSTPSRRW